MDISEKNIITLIRQGENAGYKYIYDNYYPLLCSIAHQFLNDSDLAEYMVDDLIITIYEKRKQINIKTSLKNYLIRSIKNRCLNHVNSSANSNTISINGLLVGNELLAADPSIRLIEKELEYQLNSAIENLPKECREVFKMSRFNNLTYEEIATELGISVNTVKYHMKNALASLTRDFQKYLLAIVFFLNLK